MSYAPRKLAPAAIRQAAVAAAHAELDDQPGTPAQRQIAKLKAIQAEGRKLTPLQQNLLQQLEGSKP